jgi:hypothetical protein
MKRIVVLAAALLTLTAMSAVTATASSASVRQPDGQPYELTWCVAT